MNWPPQMTTASAVAVKRSNPFGLPVAPAARLPLAAFAVVSVVQLVARATGADLVGNITKPMIIPFLMAFVLVSVGPGFGPSSRWLGIGLSFAWFGDIALMSQAQVWFAVGILMFLVMQLCYIRGYFRLGAREGLRRKRWLLVVYPAFWVVANIALWPGLGTMRVPIMIYSAALVTMAMCSVAVGPWMGLGGTLFMFSDLMIGEGVAYGSFPGSSFLIMLLYILGQLIICMVWAERVRRRWSEQAQGATG